MHALSLALLTLVATASAYQVTVPNTSQGWTSNGAQTLTWQRVSSDQTNFAVVLVNQNPSQFPSPGYQQVLNTLVDGTSGTIQLNPPSTGWPTGPHFRVNLVRDSQSLDSILAQSQEFTIGSVSGGTTQISTPTGTTFVVPPTNTVTDINPTDSPASTNSSAALPEFGAPTGLLGAVTLVLSFFLAQFLVI